MDYRWLIDLLGWIGSIELVTAYFLVSYERMLPTSSVYQWMNFSASVLLLINTAYYGAFPSSFVNVVWCFIALASLYRILKLKTDA